MPRRRRGCPSYKPQMRTSRDLTSKLSGRRHRARTRASCCRPSHVRCASRSRRSTVADVSPSTCSFVNAEPAWAAAAAGLTYELVNRTLPVPALARLSGDCASRAISGAMELVATVRVTAWIVRVMPRSCSAIVTSCWSWSITRAGTTVTPWPAATSASSVALSAMVPTIRGAKPAASRIRAVARARIGLPGR